MITVFKPAEITVSVIDGPPPVDQSAEVAALTAQVAALTGELEAVQASNADLAAKIVAAQAALA